MSASLEQGALGPESFDHEFKSHPDVFWPAARGEKMFEYRRDDRGGYEVGQTVRLRCYDPDRLYHPVAPLDRRITNILRGGEFELPQGYCILSLAPLSASAPASGAERMTAGGETQPAALYFAVGQAIVDTILPGREADFVSSVPSIRAVAEAAVAAVRRSATPAPATPPGVPDSVREKIRLAIASVNVHAEASEYEFRADEGDHTPTDAERAMLEDFGEQILSHLEAALISTHPAGQSAGSGAFGAALERFDAHRLAISQRGPSAKRDELLSELDTIRNSMCRAAKSAPDSMRAGDEGLIASAPQPFKQTGRPSDDMLTGVAGWLKQMRDGADNLGDQLKASAALYAVSVLLAPDSPRTGDEGTEAPWWIGTGYEVCEPITDEAVRATLHASYTPNNGIRLRIEEVEDEEPGQPGMAEFDFSQDQAQRIGGKLLEWAAHNHGAARPAAPEAQGAWQDISTVPVGVEVIVRGGKTVFGDGPRGSSITVVDDREDLYRSDGTLRPSSPTLWHPAPAPPSSGQRGR